MMQYLKIVNKYYQQIFRLWQIAETPADEKIEKFIYILWPLILNPLLDCKYTNIKILLDKTKNIEEIKKDIISNFSKQEKLFTSKFSSQGSSKGFGIKSGSAISVGGSATTKGFAKSLAGTKTSGSRDCIHSNSRFRPTNKKSKSCVEPWHKLQAFSKKLTDNKQIVIAREKRCLSCRESGHRINDDCYSSKKKHLMPQKWKKLRI